MSIGQCNCLIIPLMLFCISATHAHDGMVNISGVIQDNTCELAPDSQNKQVDMGTFTGGQFGRIGDFSPAKSFSLNLQNCGPAASEATVTFSGAADLSNPDFFAIDAEADSARGLALGIYDASGTRVVPGATSDAFKLQPLQTAVKLDFSARYVSVLDSVSAGNANVTVTFVVNYS
ncbi:fimbrial protein [Enterobacter quasiroggenkampii]|uniref:fimbrial protein n=1 Tax=Enterobacter quasiroggenkampii TaxID=2497436 RepID=UPI0021D107F8|nr:fimbrial protein [Enterobacter quasiroggenkampii]MCU6278863.1 fimbrial protein [Enterobacter quasiroggenkampii]